MFSADGGGIHLQRTGDPRRGRAGAIRTTYPFLSCAFSKDATKNLAGRPTSHHRRHGQQAKGDGPGSGTIRGRPGAGGQGSNTPGGGDTKRDLRTGQGKAGHLRRGFGRSGGRDI